ncbi:MAG: HNH endonuclease, partial [Caldilineae bacterium]
TVGKAADRVSDGARAAERVADDVIHAADNAAAGGAKRTPRRATAAQKERALERSRGSDGKERCTYCGTELDRRPGKPNSAEIDHVHPYSKGGETVDTNLNAACRTCNRSKGAKELGTEWVPPKEP